MWYKICALSLLVLGEVLTIYAEMAGARISSTITSLASSTMLGLGVLVVVGSILLFMGYSLGQIAFQDIWVVSAVSVGTILIVEPFLAYSLFHELPSKGAFVGLAFGFAGLIITLVW